MNAMMKLLKRAYADERGAEGLEKVLIIGAIVVPVLLLLMFFRDTIADWFRDKSDEVLDDDFDPQG